MNEYNLDVESIEKWTKAEIIEGWKNFTEGANNLVREHRDTQARNDILEDAVKKQAAQIDRLKRAHLALLTTTTNSDF